jgi:hypothetical protein
VYRPTPAVTNTGKASALGLTDRRVPRLEVGRPPIEVLTVTSAPYSGVGGFRTEAAHNDTGSPHDRPEGLQTGDELGIDTHFPGPVVGELRSTEVRAQISHYRPLL